MKIIFLDFDGVLNSVDWYIDWYMRRTGKKKKSFLEAELDPDAVKRLVSILTETGAKIVISSSWRILHTLDEICLHLGEASGHPPDWWDSKIIGLTPRIHTKTDGLIVISAVRGDEIDHWLRNTTAEVDNYVIIDDDSDMLDYQKSRFVHTNNQHGLTDEKAQEVIEILK